MRNMGANFTGSWTADLSKSMLTSPKPTAVRIMIEHRDPELRQELIVTKADSTEDRAVFICRTTGVEGNCRLNGNAVRGRAGWIGDELTIETWMNFGDRELYFCDCWSLSPDGQTLVMEHRNDALGGQRMILERISSAPPEDAIAEPR